MTRAQQTQVLTRLRELQAILATVDYRPHDAELERTPSWIVGYCQSLVERTLEEAGEKAEGR
jgi:hypothetical protein